MDQERWQPGKPVFVKIDVESFEPQVLKGGKAFIDRFRPLMVIEILPDSDVQYFERFLINHSYTHLAMNPNNQLSDTKGVIQTSLHARDHLFVPTEQLEQFVSALQ